MALPVRLNAGVGRTLRILMEQDLRPLSLSIGYDEG